MSEAEKEIWRAAYAAAFVAEVASVAAFHYTGLGSALERDGIRGWAVEVARGVADEAVLGLRETAKYHSAGLSTESMR